ncbi:hypothetical protein BH09MYX1_BH09MYX1_20890 [soil metagenome]
MKRFVLVLALAALLHCGLESAGQRVDDSGIDSGDSTEAGVKCACVPLPGPGWSFVAYARDGTAPCEGAYATPSPRVAVEAIAPPAQCSCLCTPATNATCTVTADAVSAFGSSNCGGNPDKTINGSAACFDIAPNYDPTNGISVKGTATVVLSGGSCNEPQTTKMLPPPEVHSGETCPLVGALGSGCAASAACVPPAPGFSICVTSDQPDAACPTGYDTKHVVGVTIDDRRDCAPSCTCAPSTSCTVDGQFFGDDGTCAPAKKDGVSFPLDGACHPASSKGVSAHSLGTITNSVQQCMAQGYAPTGAVALTEAYTVCCL